ARLSERGLGRDERRGVGGGRLLDHLGGRIRVLRLAEGGIPPWGQQGARLPVPHHLCRRRLGHRAVGRGAGGREDHRRNDYPFWRVLGPASV
ncbi:MAG: hypothetical protein AVDCRST_MAG55-3301, partial [uncultured Rubrobacteraceae bacterium]